jgi:hypothetical protein
VTIKDTEKIFELAFLEFQFLLPAATAASAASAAAATAAAAVAVAVAPGYYLHFKIYYGNYSKYLLLKIN